jgi:hypothetical protein
MYKLRTILLAAAAAGGLATSAAAMPLNDLASQGPGVVQDVRMICNERGRCIETPRHAYRYHEDYDYAPRAYGYEDPGYSYYAPGPGVGFSFGFGPHHWR